MTATAIGSAGETASQTASQAPTTAALTHSVVIPAYNAEPYIRQAIESALIQLGPDDRVIVVDDGSQDNTAAVVRLVIDPRVTLICAKQNGGIATARNLALPHVQTDYLHFLDSDDLWPVGRMDAIETCINGEQPPPDVISGHIEHFYCDSLSESQRRKFSLPPRQGASLPGSVVLSRNVMRGIGLFDETLTSGEFIDWIVRVLQLKVHWVKLDAVFLRRRIHGANHTRRDTMASSAYLRVVRRHLAQRRQG